MSKQQMVMQAVAAFLVGVAVTLVVTVPMIMNRPSAPAAQAPAYVSTTEPPQSSDLDALTRALIGALEQEASEEDYYE